ncbi:MAG: riboflavin synthase [Gemmatimonadetes bacterium]|nr:riboflavin synthase [Gemmatimonadota bacterium]NNL31540.1 riboflavin synthase [Gemmatimonadota bacterium]
MFTGIVETTGRVVEVQKRESTSRLRFGAPTIAGDLGLGDSVAVDGACLTVTELSPDEFSVDVIGTTLDRTVAGMYGPGARVNLERAARLNARIDGHLVQGHVDGIGHLRRRVKSGEYWLLDFDIPTEILDLTVEHGSITLNGVSLTVSELLPESGVRIGVIPYTYEHTNLGELEEGSPVNVEGDLIGKYVARILSARGRDPAGKLHEGRA